jgi:hypothetical protein
MADLWIVCTGLVFYKGGDWGVGTQAVVLKSFAGAAEYKTAENASGMGLDKRCGSKKLHRDLRIRFWLPANIKLQKTRSVWVWTQTGVLKSFSGAS